MIKVLDNREISIFDYIYMTIMYIYMCQNSKITSVMVGLPADQSLLFLLIPILLTYVFILVNRKKSSIYINNNLLNVIGIFSVWFVCQLIKYDFSGFVPFFFIIYAIIIANIHVRILGKKIFYIYENITVFFSKISLILWLFAVLAPTIATPFFKSFPVSDYGYFGNNFLFIFTWMDSELGQMYGGILRNAGPSWEPGRFAVILLLGITFNFMRNGVKLKGNANFIWMLIALVSTQSTTGYCIFFFLLLYFMINRISVLDFIKFSLFLIPLVYVWFGVDFLGDKVAMQTDVETYTTKYEQQIDFAESNKDSEYRISLDRIVSMKLEFLNIINDPLLGYGKKTQNSYVYDKISEKISLTGGLLKLFSQFGIPLALILYYLLFKSSIIISKDFGCNKKYAIFFCFVLSTISYDMSFVPLYMSIWFYGIIKYDNHKYTNENLYSNYRSIP